jgi:hypothetical protein
MTRFGAGTGRWSALAWTAALKILAPDSDVVDELELNLTHPFLQRTIRPAFHCSAGHQHQSSTRASIDPGLAVESTT